MAKDRYGYLLDVWRQMIRKKETNLGYEDWIEVELERREKAIRKKYSVLLKKGYKMVKNRFGDIGLLTKAVGLKTFELSVEDEFLSFYFDCEKHVGLLIYDYDEGCDTPPLLKLNTSYKVEKLKDIEKVEKKLLLKFKEEVEKMI